MSIPTLTNKQARRALLSHQCLWPPRSLRGPEGVLSYMNRVGSIQFDPVDVAGISPEIALSARVRGFRRKHLDDLLYKSRRLYDVWDKNACIALTEHHKELLQNQMTDWGWRPRINEADLTQALHAELDAMLANNNTVSNADVLSNPLLKEILLRRLNSGEIGIHHRSGRERYYADSKGLLPEEMRGIVRRDEIENARYYVKRRVGSVGLLWNRRSDAFLGIGRMTTQLRQQAFESLIQEKALLPVSVEGIRDPLYIRSGTEAILDPQDSPAKAAYIAPLDNLLWDRKLIETLFGFHYTWEIYTPADKRKYGAYTLPVLYGDTFIARVQLKRQEGRLLIQDWWWADGVRVRKAMLPAIRAAHTAHAQMLGLEPDEIGDL